MGDVKMSDVFDLPVDFDMNMDPRDLSWSVSIEGDMSTHQVENIEYAINNHDRLVQERDGLLANLDLMLLFANSVQLNVEKEVELDALISKIQGDKI